MRASKKWTRCPAHFADVYGEAALRIWLRSRGEGCIWGWVSLWHEWGLALG